MKEKLIHNHVYNPKKSLFKTSGNDRAGCYRVYCSFDGECPLFERGCCASRDFFTRGCPYGRKEKLTGPTPRAKSFHSWIQSHEIESPSLDSPPKKIAFVGEWVYLPYAHMDMCESVPFVHHGGAFRCGQPFIPRTEWTIETVCKLLDFRPQALIGGEITTYQREEIPKFIEHLKETEIWPELIKARPTLDKPANYVGREAYLRTLKPGISWKGDHGVWSWDGELAHCEDYKSVFLDIKSERTSVMARPEKDFTIKVESNDWVSSETEFKD